MKTGTCKFCCNKFELYDKPKGWMANHTRWCEYNPKRLEENKNKIKICTECSQEYKGRNTKFCSAACQKAGFKHSDDTKDKISKARNKYLMENPDKHVWKRKDKFKSAPCEMLKAYLIENDISFIEEWQPLDNRFFSIDIAFPERKIGIEVNGNQHYNRDGSLREYYQERHELIESFGWKLYEIHYSDCFDPEMILLNIDLGIQPDYTAYFEQKEKSLNNKKKTKPRGETARENNLEKNKPIVKKLMESNINFSKFGWVKLAAEIIEIREQKVGSWMKRNMPEFYNENCFKRNRRVMK